MKSEDVFKAYSLMMQRNGTILILRDLRTQRAAYLDRLTTLHLTGYCGDDAEVAGLRLEFEDERTMTAILAAAEAELVKRIAFLRERIEALGVELPPDTED